MSETLNRRDMIKGAVLASAALGTTISATAVKASDDSHQHHHHHEHNKNKHVVKAAMKCLADGQACLDHCFQLFADGDTSVAKCAESVTEMISMVTALHQMASYRSTHLKSLAKVCAAVCKDCQKECEKHDEHVECKACAESCKDCIEACESIV